MPIGPGTRALVTGASRGIGRAFATELAARGARVGLAARSEDDLRALAGALPGDGHVVLPCDVGDRASVEAAVERYLTEAGGLDLLVVNAGIATYGPALHVEVEAVEAMTRVNWLGTVYTVKAALGHMLSRAEGHIVVVASGASLRAFPWAGGYGATKAAQRAWADALFHELSGSGVDVTTVFPGEFESELHAGDELMPDWYRPGRDPAELVAATLRAVDAGRRYVYHPPAVRLLGALHGLSPRLSDAVLRRVRGGTAAPRRG